METHLDLGRKSCPCPTASHFSRELLTFHETHKQNNFLIARTLKKEGVQFTVPVSGNVKVSIYSLTNFAKLTDGESCAIWHNQSHPDCCHNAAEEVGDGKASKLLCVKFQVWEETYTGIFYTKHDSLKAAKLVLK